jgi:pyruvate kinase
MRRHRRAKIVATVGPASSSPDMLKKLFLAGVDTFRLNFSHGSHEDHAKVHAAIRALEAELGSPIGILQDLQGPKIRVGTIKDGKIKALSALSVGRGRTTITSRFAGDSDSEKMPVFRPRKPNQASPNSASDRSCGSADLSLPRPPARIPRHKSGSTT